MSAGFLHVRPVPILRKSTAFLQNCVHHVKPPHPVPPTIRPGATSRHPDNKHPHRRSAHLRPRPLLPPGPLSRHRGRRPASPSLLPRRHRRSRGHRRGHRLTCSPALVSARSPSSTATSSNPPTSNARFLFDEADALESLPKAEAARRKIALFNSTITVHPKIADLVPANIHELLGPAQLVLDATDNFETRYLINDYAVQQSKPWIYAAAIGAYAATMNVLPKPDRGLAYSLLPAPYSQPLPRLHLPQAPHRPQSRPATPPVSSPPPSTSPPPSRPPKPSSSSPTSPISCAAPSSPTTSGQTSAARSAPAHPTPTAPSAASASSPISPERAALTSPSAAATPSRSTSTTAPSTSPPCAPASNPTAPSASTSSSCASNAPHTQSHSSRRPRPHPGHNRHRPGPLPLRPIHRLLSI